MHPHLNLESCKGCIEYRIIKIGYDYLIQQIFQRSVFLRKNIWLFRSVWQGPRVNTSEKYFRGDSRLSDQMLIGPSSFRPIDGEAMTQFMVKCWNSPLWPRSVQSCFEPHGQSGEFPETHRNRGADIQNTTVRVRGIFRRKR